MESGRGGTALSSNAAALSSPRAPADAAVMGDWLRRVLYPLVLPLIIGTVWVCGWVRQQDDRAARARWTMPPVTVDKPASRSGPMPTLPSTPAPAAHTDFFAAAAAEDAAE